MLVQYLAQQSAQPSAPPAGGPGGAAGGGGPLQNFMPMIMIALIFASMWFFMIRPQRKEEKRKKDMLASLKKGDPVTTTGGILGTVATVKDETVILKVGDGTKMEFLKSAIGLVRGTGKSEKEEK